MKFHRELITVERAKDLLSRNSGNRGIRPTKLKQYVEAMRAGEWRETHQGIALNCDGSLKDGQHRLAAIVESGCPQWMLVCNGLTDDAMLVVDTGASRSISDAMLVLGHHVTMKDVAVGRAMLASVDTIGGSSYSRDDIIRFVLSQLDAIQFTHPLLGSVGGQAPVRAAVARAWYTRDRDRLTEFMTAMQSGVVQSQDDQAVVSFCRLLSQGKIRPGASQIDKRIAYRRTCSVLLAFLERRPLAKVYEVTIDPFPIPE